MYGASLFVDERFRRFTGLCYICNIVQIFLYLPIRQAMKFDGSFVIVINLSISLLCSQTGGFFVLNSPRSKYVEDKSNNP